MIRWSVASCLALLSDALQEASNVSWELAKLVAG